MNDPDDRALAEAWRQLVARRVHSAEDPTPEDSLAEMRSSLLALADRIRPWLLPPQRAHSDETTALLSQWTPAWTRELTGSQFWGAAKSQLAEIRQLIGAGNLEDADWELCDLLIRCVPSARRVALEGFPARAGAQNSHQGAPAIEEPSKSPEEAAEDLTCLVAWLESFCPK